MKEKEKILEILSAILEHNVDETCSFETDDNWDSINHIQIVVSLEEEFNVRIPQEKIPEMKSFNKILEVMESLC